MGERMRRLRPVAHRSLQLLADEELMGLVCDRDADAFEVLYDRHAGPAFSLAYRIVGERGAAEEVCQECFVALWRTAERYDPSRGSARTWILGIVHHRAIDSIRRSSLRARRQTHDDRLEEHEARELTDVEAARREEAREVQSALRELPADQVRVLELAYFGGFTQNEIANMLETPLGTVKSRMRRGLEAMSRTLEVAS
jgi:RNA polymerase sigma-70 factor (ECF subfamily)